MREIRVKADYETVERERDWYEAEYKEKADISRISDQAMDKAELEASAGKNSNTINRAAVEAPANIRFSSEIHGDKREREESDTR